MILTDACARADLKRAAKFGLEVGISRLPRFRMTVSAAGANGRIWCKRNALCWRPVRPQGKGSMFCWLRDAGRFVDLDAWSLAVGNVDHIPFS